MRYSFLKAMPRPAKRQYMPVLLLLRRFILEDQDEKIGDKPLFDSLSDLARTVAIYESVPSKMNSLIPMIQQGLVGERPFKKERAIALRQAVVERIQQRAPDHLDELTKRFDYVFYLVDKTRRHPYETTSGRNLQPANPGGAILVIVPHVRDIVMTDRGLALVRMFIAGYGLSGRDVPPHLQQKHLIAFADDDDIFTFLVTVISESVYEELGERDRPLRQEQVQKVWTRLEAVFRKNALLFALLPAPYCLNAVTVYNCEREDGDAHVLSYGGGDFRYIQIYGKFRQGYRQLYHDLMAGSIEGARFIEPSLFHEKIMYQLISASAVV